jgi:hypothetical protein
MMASFEGARLKLRRAGEHYERLTAIADAYFQDAPFTCEYQPHEATHEHSIVVTDVKPIPPEVVLLTGEIVQALRTALDYTVASLVEFATGGPPPAKSKFEFPIFADSDEYDRQKRRKLDGVHEDDIKVIDSLQPFADAKPTKHSLWHVHRLNIEDKHRRLHVVAGALLPREVRHTGITGADAFSFDAKWIDDPLRFPLVVGLELFRYRSSIAEDGDEVHLEFQPTLAFSEPEDVRRRLVLPMLASLQQNVAKVVEMFASAWE